MDQPLPVGKASQMSSEPTLRREIASLRLEIQRLDRLLGLLRLELRSARGGFARPTPRKSEGWRARMRTEIRSSAFRIVERVRISDAEHAVRHRSPSRSGQLLRAVRNLPVAGRVRRRPLFNADPESDDAGVLVGPATSADEVPARDLNHQVTEARRALAQRHALLVLLRGELRQISGEPPEPPRPVDPSVPRSVDLDGLMPTEAMASRLVGRVRVVDPNLGGHNPKRDPPGSPAVTVAIRFHDTRELPALERCLYSLQAQRGAAITPLVVFQGTDTESLAMIGGSLDRVWLLGPTPRLVAVPNPDGRDLRTALLNRALDIHYEETDDDFFFVLDHDDVVFSHALASMAGPIVGTDAAVSFGKVLVARYLSLDGYDVLYRMDDHFKAAERDITEITVDNFCPIHSYIYHTRAMAPTRLRFNEAMDRLEDYEALLRVVTRFPVYTGAIDTMVGLYCWTGPRAIAGPIEGAVDQEGPTWERNRRLLAETFVGVVTRPEGAA